MAPEFLRDKDVKFTEEMEAYSFGVLLWEIFHQSNEPYPEMQPVQILFQVSNYGLRPKMAPDIHPRVRTLIE